MVGTAVLQASAGAAELAAAQSKATAQLLTLESQLASKDTALEASRVRLAALEAELNGAHSKVRSPSRHAGIFVLCCPCCMSKAMMFCGYFNADR